MERDGKSIDDIIGEKVYIDLYADFEAYLRNVLELICGKTQRQRNSIWILDKICNKLETEQISKEQKDSLIKIKEM